MKIKQIIVVTAGLLQIAISTYGFTNMHETRAIQLSIGGLHCEGCVAPVENGLKKVTGVSQAKLDFKTGIATLQFNEHNTSLSKLTLSVADIPHAMGRKMKYSARFMLPLQAGAGANAEKARKAVSAIKGVQKVEQSRNRLYITFHPKTADVTFDQISKAVQSAGFKINARAIRP